MATAGIGVAALLGGCSLARSVPDSSSSATLQVDFSKTAFFPLLKSKIGVGRALDSTQILDSLQYLDDIRPALYDAELRFPDTSWPSMTPYPVEEGAGGRIQVVPNEFLNNLYAGLHQRDIEIMVQLEGAPKQWFDYAKAKRPRVFPFPSDLTAAASAIGEWVKLYSGYPISWCMWNEPSHNLTGSADLTSISQLIDIYGAYTNAIAPQGSFGMASFVPVDANVSQKLGGRSYVAAVLDELRRRRAAEPGLPFDYITMNNYGEDLGKLYDGVRDALGADFNTVPLIQAQSGVFMPGEWERNAGSTLEAARSMAALEQALQVPDLQTFTFSGWLPHMIDYRNGTALQLPLFNALKLYARMPDRRASLQGQLPSGLGAMASGDQYRGSVLVWNETNEPRDIELALSGLPASGQNGTALHVYHIDSEHGSPLEHGEGTFTFTENVQLPRSAQVLSKTVTVAGPGIAYVEIGTASSHPALDRGALAATLVRKHTYADRITGAKGTSSVRGNAYGSYDAVRAIAYLGIEGAEGIALCGAEYRGLPNTLGIAIAAELPAAHSTSSEALFGIRVDYVLAGGGAKSVLWHGDIFDSRRTGPLPWGRRGPTADVVVLAPELDRARAGSAKLTLTLADYAPSGWASDGQRAIISFWMDSTGPDSQARFLLG